MSLPVQVIFCGGQGIDYGEDERTGEPKQVGFRLRPEGETGYEAEVLTCHWFGQAGPSILYTPSLSAFRARAS